MYMYMYMLSKQLNTVSLLSVMRGVFAQLITCN